jgi:opacity protein-like surface antigen
MSMQFSKTVPTTILSSLVLITSLGAKAQDTDQQGWYLKPTLALSQMSDQTVNTTGVGALDGSGNAALSSGFASGLVLGYDYGSRWSAELGWEYRSNGSEVSLADGQRFNDGNYASNTFFINALYGFAEGQVWQPYAGFGLSFIQEIDIDLETPAAELSYAGDGDTGFQVFAGVERELAARWSLLGEVRYTRFSGIELTGENTVGTMGGLDYTPLSLQLGVKFRF